MKKLFVLSVVFAAVFLSGTEKPLARVGLMTDTHVTPNIASCASLKKALLLFKSYNVDLIANCGDVAETHKQQAYKNYRATVKSVYPVNKPKELFSFAWHDVAGMGTWRTGWANAWPGFKKGLELEHEAYSKHYLAGYIFLTAPQNTDLAVYEKMISDACKETPGKPVFLIDHVPGAHTTFNTDTWGDPRTRKILNKYPQVIQISGHVHGTFRNELQIWQGEFTQVNVGCTSQYWSGNLVGTAPKSQRSDQALLLEIYKNKVVFRRFDLADGKEYKKDSPWSFPIPYDPETAPYTAKKRQLVPAPEFSRGAKISVQPDKVPCDNVILSFPEAQSEDGTYIYKLELFRQTPAGKWEKYAYREVHGGFLKNPDQRITATHLLSAGYFDDGKNYKVRVTPCNFYGKAGKALEVQFKMPAKKQHTVRFESKNPMKDCPFVNEYNMKQALKVKNGFYQHPSGNASLLFPREIWKGESKSRFRFTIDIHMKQPGTQRPWTIVLRNPKPRMNAHSRLTTAFGDSGVLRYVIEFSKWLHDFTYYLLIREGEAGELRFDYVKIEKLD